MPFDEVHGRIRHKGEIEHAAIAHLKTWIRYYLALATEQHELREIAEPRTFATVSEFETFPEEGLPAIIVMTGQVIGTPERRGDGTYSAMYPLHVSIVAAAASAPVARTTAHVYGAAVRALMLQKQKIGDKIAVIGWEGDDSLTLGSVKSKNRVAVEETFTVRMKDIISDLSGPDATEPPDEPPTEWPAITDTDVDATHMADES